MKIAIIGAGNVGRALGGAWRTDHDITYGVRSPDDAKYADLDAATATNDAAAAASDVVVLCTPWQGTEDAVKACGDLSDKVLIDCTNPLTPDFTALEIGHTTSGAEQVAAWAPGARVCTDCMQKKRQKSETNENERGKVRRCVHPNCMESSLFSLLECGGHCCGPVPLMLLGLFPDAVLFSGHLHMRPIAAHATMPVLHCTSDRFWSISVATT